MTFPAIRAMWTDATVLTAAEMAQFDEQMQNALDGAAGGTYAPSSVLEIGGSGVAFPTDVELTGNLITDLAQTELQGDGWKQPAAWEWEIGDGVALAFTHAGSSGAMTFDDLDLALTGGSFVTSASTPVIIAGAASLTGDAQLTALTGTQIIIEDGGTLTSVPGSTVDFDDIDVVDIDATGNVGIGGTLGVVGDTGLVNLDVGGTASFFGDLIANDPLKFAGDGHLVWRVITGADSTTSYGYANGNFIWVPAGTLTGNRVYTILDASAETGSVFTVSRKADMEAFTLTLRREDATTINTMAAGGVTHLIFVGGRWEEYDEYIV